MHTVLSGQSSQCYMGRFEYGSDIITELEQFCATNNIQYAWVQVIGALSKATIGYYDQKDHKYFSREVAGDYEIVSCSGNISTKQGKPFAHLHIILSDTDYNTIAGHLMPGTVTLFAGEFIIQAIEKTDQNSSNLDRTLDPQTDLYLW